MRLDPCCKSYFNMKKRKIGILVILQKTARVSFFGKPPPQSKPSPTSIPPLSLFFFPLLSLPPPPPLSLPSCLCLPSLSSSPPAYTAAASSPTPPRPAQPPSLRLPGPRLPLPPRPLPLPARGCSPAAGHPALDLAGACSARRPATPRCGGPGRPWARHQRSPERRP